MKKYSHETKNRIISITLAFLLILATIYTVPLKGGVNAAAVATGDTLTCSMQGSSTGIYYMVSTDTGINVQWNAVPPDDAGSIDMPANSNLVMEQATSMTVKGNVSLGSVDLKGGAGSVALFNIYSGYSARIGTVGSSTGVGGRIQNEGTLYVNNFSTNTLDSSGVYVSNYGTVEASTISLYQGSFDSGSDAVYKASTSFYKDNFDLAGTVIATSADTVIKSDGGDFTLSYNGITKSISGNVDGTAGDLVKKDIMLTIGTFPTIYAGTEYNLLDKVIVSEDDYDGEIQTKYYYNGGFAEYTEGIPNTYGYWEVEFTAPATERFHGAVASTSYHIDLLDMPDNPITMSGVKNGVYVKDSITFTAKSGYLIDTSEPDSTFSEKAVFSLANLEDKGSSYGSYFNDDMYFTLKRKSDGAETDSGYWIDCFPELEDLIIDPDKPVIDENPIVDGEPKAIVLGDDVAAEKIEFTVTDAYLDKVVSTDKTYTEENGGIVKNISVDDLTAGSLNENSSCVVTFTAKEGEPKNCSFTAYDKAGNEKSFRFKLTHPKDLEKEEEEEEEKVVLSDSNLSVSLSDKLVGVDYAPTVKTDSDGDVIIVYKKKGTADGTFTEDKPTEPGAYVVRAIVKKTDKYKEAVAEDEFNLSYLDAPKDAYSIVGTKGKNDYYISDVTLKAKEGFKISRWLRGTYTDSVLYTEGIGSVCLRRDSDGALTAPIDVTEKLKIDKDKPHLSSFGIDENGKTVDLNKTVYADELTFSIFDEHLTSVMVNGKPQKLVKNEAEIELEAGSGEEIIEIIATDEAGNEYSLSITLCPQWMKDMTIPSGRLVSLVSGQAYNLGSGKWKIEGDSTIYNGGGSIYISTPGEYTFTKID